MRLPAHVTVSLLRKLRACEGKIYRFKVHFPKGAKITLKNCQRAEEAGLNLPWLAHRLLYKQTGYYWEKFLRGNNVKSEDFYHVYRLAQAAEKRAATKKASKK